MMQRNRPLPVSLHSCMLLIMTFLLLIDFIACASTSNRLGYKDFVSKTSTSEKVCQTTGCIEAASVILKNMDAEVSPCENFYQFACGKIVKESVIPEEKSSVSSFSLSDENLKRQLRSSLERKIKNDSPRTFQLLQSFYNTCLDTDKINKTSTNEVLSILKELGDWPVTAGRSWNTSNFNWRKLIYKMRDLGYTESMEAFIEFGIELDDEDNSRYVIILDQASLGINQKYLLKGLNEKIVQAYYKYMVDVAEVLGANRQQAQKELLESLDFEIELAKISLPMEDRRNMSKLYNPMTIEQLESEYPEIPWSEYINQILSPKTIGLNDRIIVRVPSFLKSIPKLINNTPKRVLANYAVWRVVQDSTYFMNERVKRIKAEFIASITGTSVQMPRYTQCLKYVSSNLDLATGALYVRESFDKKSKEIVEEIVDGLSKSFASLLDKVDWMDESTKAGAKRKLSLVKKYVAYPDEFLDDEILDGYYETLQGNTGSFLKNHLNLNLFEYQKALDKLNRPVDKTDWTTHGYSAIVNALYAPSENSIQIPAGILHGVFFASDRPIYMNYAAIGWIIGHELTHGFDDEGSQYDGEGNLIDWWEAETKKEYFKRAQCIIEQYSNYSVNGLNLNGKNTQGENIADIGGIKEAYFAFEEYERKNGEQLRLSGLPHYTPRQMFWITAANIWCGKYRSEAVKNVIITGVHTPREYRVIGSFSNMPQFARDFECPIGSPMNPSKKCTVW